MEQGILVYDNDIVQDSSLSPKYLTTLADVATRDYKSDYGFSKNVAALDIDKVETDRCGSNDKTMDTAIGIANYKGNKVSSSRLLLIELRMNYTGQGQNAKTSDMKAKDTHTRGLLADSQIDPHSFFIFNKDVAPHKKNSINREAQVDSCLKKWIILSPEEFVNQFLFVEDLPYKPESPVDSIRKEGCNLVALANFENAIHLVNHWLNKTREFHVQYKLEECKVLISVIDEVLSAIESHSEELTEDCDLDAQIAREELVRFISLLS
ncbi:MAG: hypothetical protein K2M96_10650 [Prevotella sp.]|nr:hypothetical protein [Prevotella sp.]